jgi:hypothetical protein
MSDQSAFTAAILDPARPAPKGLIGPGGKAAGKRFDVYRNNVAVGLTDALLAAYPAVAKLVGDEFFTAMAGVYLRAHPPQSRMMKDYGDGFAAFLKGFPPAQSLGYLPDVARLEAARRRAYHARDAAAIDPQALAQIAPDTLPQLRFTFAPAVQLIASKWPALSIWRANMEGGEAPQAAPEEILIARPEFDPVQALLPIGGVALLTTLQKGEPLGAALAIAPRDFDLSQTIGALIQTGALTHIEAPK